MAGGMEKGSFRRSLWYFLVAVLTGMVFGFLEGAVLWGVAAGVLAGLVFAGLAKMKII